MFGQPQLKYQRQHVWLIFLASMDIMLTWIILSVGGHEENFLAAMILGSHGPTILLAYKFPLVILVIIFCEEIGRRKDDVARKLALTAIAISAFPVTWSLGLLIWSLKELPAQLLE